MSRPPSRRGLGALLCLAVSALQGQGAAMPLRLTRRQALQLAVTNLLQARIARELREAIRQEPVAEQGSFDWRLDAAITSARSRFGDLNPRSSGLDSLYLTRSDTTEQTRRASLGLSRLLPQGGTVDLSLGAGYDASAIQLRNQALPAGPAAALGFSTVNPYSGRLVLSFTQPWLQGSGRTATEAKLRAAVEQAKAADDGFRQRMEDLLVAVDSLYWNQVHARQALVNKQAALDLSRQQLAEDRERVRSGLLAPLELPQVEAAEAEREKDVIAARGQLRNAEDSLLEELFPAGDRPPALELQDQPEAGPEPVSLAEARSAALDHRPELDAAGHAIAARKSLEAAAENATLPRLDTEVSLSRDSTAHPGPAGVWDDWAQDSYPGYYVGLKFSCPIGNRTSRARLAQARAATRDSELTLADTRTGVLLEVEHAFNDLTAARKEVEAADKALAFRGESLDAEMSKFKEGMSTSFFVLQRQEELDQARTNDLDARIDAEKARTRFERAMGTLGEALDQAPDRRL